MSSILMSRSPRAAYGSGTVESDEAHGIADRAPQLSWEYGGSVGVSGRILRAGKAASFFKIHRETLANLSITGHLCCFSDQPVADIHQVRRAIA
jgi:hypothetical protein